MPLNINDALNEILTFSDEDETGGQVFKGFPSTPEETAEYWSEVFVKFFQATVHPPGFAIAATLGKEPFKAAFLAAFSGAPLAPTGAAAIIAGATAFALALVPGALPFVAIPPAVPLIFVPQPPDPARPPVVSATVLAQNMLTWASTGFADLPPPVGTPNTTGWA